MESMLVYSGVSCQRCGLNTRVQSADEKRESNIEDDLLKECNDLLTGPGCVHSDYHLSVDPGVETSQRSAKTCSFCS